MKLKRIIIISSIGLAILGIALVVYRQKTKPLEVTLAMVETSDLSKVVSGSGKINSKNRADLGFIGGGKIATVSARVGSHVQVGRFLAALDKENLRQSLNAAEATLKRAVDSLKYAKAKQKEIETIYIGGVETEASKQILRQYEKSVHIAENDVTSAEASLEIAKRNLANADLIAPISGIVTSVNIRAGEIAAATVPVVTIADLENIVFEAELDEEKLGRVRLSQPTTVYLESYPGLSFSGLVSDISPQAGTAASGATVFEVEISVDDFAEAAPRLGMNGRAEILVDRRDTVLVVPFEAVVTEDGKNFVYIVESDRLRRQEVVLGLENDEYFEVLGGLEEGEKVAVTEINQLTEGKRVKVK